MASNKPSDGLESRAIPTLRMVSPSGVPLQLSQDAMLFLLEKVQAGERNLARSACTSISCTA